MFEFLKRKKEEKKFEPRIFKFYDTDAKTLWRLWDEYRKEDTRQAKYSLWSAINKRIPDTDITEDGTWIIEFGNALVFAIIETEK
jgi:hypothetical protein